MLCFKAFVLVFHSLFLYVLTLISIIYSFFLFMHAVTLFTFHKKRDAELLTFQSVFFSPSDPQNVAPTRT